MKITIVNLEGYTYVSHETENSDEIKTLRDLWTIMKLEGLDVYISPDGDEMKCRFEEKVKLPGFDLFYTPKNFDITVKQKGKKILRTYIPKNEKGRVEADNIFVSLWNTENCVGNSRRFQLETKLKGEVEVPYN